MAAFRLRRGAECQYDSDGAKTVDTVHSKQVDNAEDQAEVGCCCAGLWLSGCVDGIVIGAGGDCLGLWWLFG